MRTGITLTDSSDLSYIGLRKITGTQNVTETTILWSNDLAANQEDDMVFRFARADGGSAASQTINTNNLNVWNDYDGRHIARFTGSGRFALGPTFGRGNAAYVLPASMLHMSKTDSQNVWMQITNRLGTQQTATDGLRIGITNMGTAHIKQQENLPLLFYTNNIENVRIEPDTASTMSGNVGKVGIGDWTTAINIANPIDAKLDIDGDLRIRQVTQDTNLVQVLVIDSTDHNRVHWRDVSTLGGNGGVNCWDINGNGINDPSEDVNGDGNFNALDCQGITGPIGPIGLTGAIGPQGPIGLTGPQGPPGNSNITADNGLSIDPLNPQNIQWGNDLTLTTAKLLNDRELPMNNFNVYFTGQGNNTPLTNNIYVGYPTAPLSPVLSKFSVLENIGNVNSTTFAGHFKNSNVGSGPTTQIVGVAGIADKPQSMVLGVQNIGGYFNAENAPFNTGVFINMNNNQNGSISRGINVNLKNSNAVKNIGGNFIVSSNNSVSLNIGIQSIISGSSSTNAGGYFAASGGNTNIGIFAKAPLVTGHYAGVFDGDLFVNGPNSNTGIVLASDQKFKTNIHTINNAMSIINQLQPRYFFFDSTAYQQINFSNKKQYGFIAQEVAPILPELVSNTIFPALFDSLGNQTSAAVNFKSLNYNAFIAILMRGLQEQNTKMDSLNDVLITQDSINNNLEDRLAALEQCVNNANLCDDDDDDDDGDNDRIGNTQSIQLANLNAIILDQNLPNPFAEKTSINYLIPDEVLEAQLLFYDMNGRIIKTVIISERGKGSLTVYGENLQNGIYTYSLIADGKLIATKKMVKQ